jgi:hypothetical protein
MSVASFSPGEGKEMSTIALCKKSKEIITVSHSPFDTASSFDDDDLSLLLPEMVRKVLSFGKSYPKVIETPPQFPGDRKHYHMVQLISYTISLRDAISLLSANRYYHSLRNDIEIQKVLIELAKENLKNEVNRARERNPKKADFMWASYLCKSPSQNLHTLLEVISSGIASGIGPWNQKEFKIGVYICADRTLRKSAARYIRSHFKWFNDKDYASIRLAQALMPSPEIVLELLKCAALNVSSEQMISFGLSEIYDRAPLEELPEIHASPEHDYHMIEVLLKSLPLHGNNEYNKHIKNMMFMLYRAEYYPVIEMLLNCSCKRFHAYIDLRTFQVCAERGSLQLLTYLLDRDLFVQFSIAKVKNINAESPIVQEDMVYSIPQLEAIDKFMNHLLLDISDDTPLLVSHPHIPHRKSRLELINTFISNLNFNGVLMTTIATKKKITSTVASC